MNAIRIETEHFEGPLELLLSLIVKNKVDIFDIPIALIAEQYSTYLEDMKRDNMEIAADFIRMAAELMLIKSKLLLPQKEDEEDPRKPLVDALLEYQRAKEASEFLKERAAQYFDRFVRQPEVLDLPYMREHEKKLLAEAFNRIYNKLSSKPEAKNEVFETIKQNREYTVEEKTLWLLNRLCNTKTVDFELLFSEMLSVGELCAGFLALLTLIAAGKISILKSGRAVLLILNHKIPENGEADTGEIYT